MTSQDDRVMWSAVVSNTAMVFFVRFLPTPTQCPFKALNLFNWPVVAHPGTGCSSYRVDQVTSPPLDVLVGGSGSAEEMLAMRWQ